MIISLLLAFFFSCFFTYLIRRYALHKSLLDIPNHRSSHTIPTPRGGGLGVVMVFLAFLVIFKLFFNLYLNTQALIGLVIASLLIASIGFWDDHQPIPARWRLLVHLGAVFIALGFLPVFPEIIIFNVVLNLSVVGYLFYGLFLVWLLNLYNFMDGIDGIASIEALSVSGSAALLLLLQGHVTAAIILILLFCCVAGFLVWNFPPAKIFMGDACSGFLGFILGLLAMISSFEGGLNLWVWLILLAVFISDASFTLGRRFLTGQVWYAAHRSHAYQHYAIRLQQQFEQQGLETTLARTKAHRQVNLYLVLINLVWLFPLAMLASFYPFWGIVLTVIAFAPLLKLAHLLNAGLNS